MAAALYRMQSYDRRYSATRLAVFVPVFRADYLGLLGRICLIRLKWRLLHLQGFVIVVGIGQYLLMLLRRIYVRRLDVRCF
jgi:hypothetical protein